MVVRMRADAPTLEANLPVSTALPGSVLLEVDASAKKLGEVRAEFVRRAVEERLARINAERAEQAA